MSELYPADGWTEIGPHQLIRFARDSEDHLHVIEAHLDRQGDWCTGHVSTNPADVPNWSLLNEHPLTLHPSLECRRCGNHGHIVDGRWQPQPRTAKGRVGPAGH